MNNSLLWDPEHAEIESESVIIGLQESEGETTSLSAPAQVTSFALLSSPTTSNAALNVNDGSNNNFSFDDIESSISFGQCSQQTPTTSESVTNARRKSVRTFRLPEETFQSKVNLSGEVYCQDESCCSKQCILNFSPCEIWQLHSSFVEKNEAEQKQFLLTCWRDSLNQQTGRQKHQDWGPMPTKSSLSSFALKGRCVCNVAFCRLQGVTKYKFNSARRAFMQGHSVSTHGNKGRIALR